MRSREAAPPERDIFEDDTETADFQLKLRHLNDLNRLVFHIQDSLANIPIGKTFPGGFPGVIPGDFLKSSLEKFLESCPESSLEHSTKTLPLGCSQY